MMTNKNFVHFIPFTSTNQNVEEELGWYYTKYNPNTKEGEGWFGTTSCINYLFEDALIYDESYEEEILKQRTCGTDSGCFWTDFQ